MMVVLKLFQGLCYVCVIWSLVPATIILPEAKTFYLGLLSRESHSSAEVAIAASETTTAQILSSCGSTEENGDAFVISCTELLPTGTQLLEKGVEIVTTDDVHLHATIGAGGTKESTLLFDENGWGSEFIVITLCDLGGFCQFSVVATEDGTSVLVTFPSSVDTDSVCIAGAGSPTGESVPFTMDKLDLLHIESETDLSGTLITSNKNVAVFAGARNVPTRIAGTTAHFIEQLIPRNKFGTDFYFVPNKNNPSGDIMKLVTSEKNTRIEITGHSPFVQPDDRKTFQGRVDWLYYTRITTNHPVIVAQFMSLDLYNDSNSVAGTPAMVLVPSIQHFTMDHFVNCDQVANINLLSFVHNAGTLTPSPNDFAMDTALSSDVPWAGYKVHVADQMTSPKYTVTGTSETGGYFCCGETSAALSGIDLSDINTVISWRVLPVLGRGMNDQTFVCYQECSTTTMSPADELDNDCDGLIDEDTCTEADLATDLTFIEYTTMPQTYNLGGTRGVTFQFESCAIGVLALREATFSRRIYLVQLSTTFVSVTYYHDSTEQTEDGGNLSLDCESRHTFWMQWDIVTGQFTLGMGGFYGKDTLVTLTPVVTPTTPLNLQYMTVSVVMGNASFTFDISGSDCGQVLSGAADVYGKSFVVPTVVASVLMLRTGTEPAECMVSELDSTVTETPHSISASKTIEHSADTADVVYMIKCDKEVGVYVQTPNNNINNGFIALPTDVLGVRYVLVTPSKNAKECRVVSLDKATTISVHSRIAVTLTGGPNLDPYSIMTLESADDMTGTIVTATRPVAVFCSSDKTSPFAMEQIPPVKTLGKTFHIPALNYPDSSTSLILWAIATEDSTYISVSGDYDEEYVLDYKGDKHVRTLDKDFDYHVTTNKGVIVSLLASAGSWTSSTIIPPVEQYDSICRLPGFQNDPDVYSKAVSETGNTSTGFATPATTDPMELDPGYNVYCLTMVNLNGQNIMINGGMMLKADNTVCRIEPGTAGDGKDNDCDMLKDEEFCQVLIEAGLVDSDVDGDINEDCISGPMTVDEVSLSLAGVQVNCNALTSAVTTPTTTTVQAPPGGSPGDVISGTTPNYESPPTIKPPSTVATLPPPLPSGATTSATTTTTASLPLPTLPSDCDCPCPCGWVLIKNYTKQEIQAKVQELQEKLTVDKAVLSSQVRRKTSAEDNRPSAVSIGYVGIVFMVVTIGCLVVLDLSTILRDVRVLVENLRAVFHG